MLSLGKAAKPGEKGCDGFITFVFYEFKEVVDKNMGDIVVTGMDAADSAFQEFIGTSFTASITRSTSFFVFPEPLFPIIVFTMAYILL